MESKQELIKQGSVFQCNIEQTEQGKRVDKHIANILPQYSRSFLHKLFAQKHVLINQSKPAKPSYALKTGDTISITFPSQEPSRPIKDIPDDIGVQIIAKEDDFLIIYKPAGLIVHPPNGTCQEVTLSDWLAKTYNEIAHIGTIDRPGIVHRLDRETSGLMIIPRTNHAHATLTDMFKERKIKKTYLAIVHNHPEPEGTINFFIGRHPIIKNKMHYFTELTKQASSKEAVSHYKVLQYYTDFSLVEVKPVTGRTHQIRVHFKGLGHPLLADQIYGQKSKQLKRHALHAHKLEFTYKDKFYEFISPIDSDLEKVLKRATKIDTTL